MGDLALLRTAKQAMEEELITQEDFEQIKTAFTKAQMIKAGLDAGFIREADYMQARDSFLQSLDFRVHGPTAPPASAHHAAPSAVNNVPSGTGLVASRVGLLTQPSMSRSVGQGGMSSPSGGLGSAGGRESGPPPPPPPQLMPAPRQAAAAFMAAAAASSAPQPSISGEAPGTIPLPTDLARIGRPGIAEGKKSMSGIGVHDSCINIYNHIKTRSAFKWVSYRIDDAGNEVIIDQLGASTSTYEQFLATLPPTQCRFAVYDYAYNNNDTGQTNQKLVFVHWAPQGSTTKAKMMYASTKEFLKGYLEGVGAELQADTQEELQEAELVARIAAGMARK